MLEVSALTLTSLTNFRDLGGMPLLGGGQTRTGRLYRSPRLTGLSPTDLTALDRAGLAAIVDFRGIQEAENAPLALSPELMHRRLSLAIEPSAGVRMRTAESDGTMSPQVAHDIMVAGYRAYVSEHADTYARFIRFVAAADGPVVFHCSAGKDRTGFAAALLLAALGVTPEAIQHDYLRTNTDWQPPADIVDGVPPSYRKAILAVDVAYLDAAFDALEREHGSAEAFVRAALGNDQLFRDFQLALTTR